MKFYFLGLLLAANLLGVGSSFAGTATLSWVPNTETDLAGYRIHFGTEPGIYSDTVDVGLTSTPESPEHILSGLADAQTYYFAITAYDTSGTESGYSNEVSKFMETSTAGPSSGGGGCGRIDVSKGSGPGPGYFPLSLLVLALPLIGAQIKRLWKDSRILAYGPLVR